MLALPQRFALLEGWALAVIALSQPASQVAVGVRIFALRVKMLGGATVSTGVGSALGCRWSASLLKMAKTKLPTTQISHWPRNCDHGSPERGPEHLEVPVTNRGLPARGPVHGREH